MEAGQLELLVIEAGRVDVNSCIRVVPETTALLGM
jgi:hypothetical protein